MTRVVTLTLLLVLVAAGDTCAAGVPTYTANVVRRLPHDPGASTQGLVFSRGRFFESTGGYGDSTVRQVDPETGTILLRRSLDPELFGEGIALHGGVLYQLTWQSGVVLLHDPDTLSPIRRLQFPREAWGVASDGRRMAVSDGSNLLRFVEPETFREVWQVAVRDGDTPVAGLNELEYVEGLLLANVFPSMRVAFVDPATGRVVCWLDLRHLADEVAAEARGAAPNGIAYDADTGRLFVTGKHWPKIFQLERPPCAGEPPRERPPVSLPGE